MCNRIVNYVLVTMIFFPSHLIRKYVFFMGIKSTFVQSLFLFFYFFHFLFIFYFNSNLSSFFHSCLSQSNNLTFYSLSQYYCHHHILFSWSPLSHCVTPNSITTPFPLQIHYCSCSSNLKNHAKTRPLPQP